MTNIITQDKERRAKAEAEQEQIKLTKHFVEYSDAPDGEELTLAQLQLIAESLESLTDICENLIKDAHKEQS